MPSPEEKSTWSLDQMTKGEFFHQKLHEWGLLEVAYRIEQVRGEALAWDQGRLGISKGAWEKVIHRGIKPVIVFVHPQVLMTIPKAVGYYRMLAMVSQKSMGRVGLAIARYETRDIVPTEQRAWDFAAHLNRLISRLIEADETIDAREFDMWRAMAAGSQAQGSWQNAKGSRIEVIIKGMVQRRIHDRGWLADETVDGSRLTLTDGRTVTLASEPDIAVHSSQGQIVVAVEIKGGIDTAGVLERVGAAIKSLSRTRQENPASTTVLLLPEIAVTPQSRADLNTNRATVNHWFTVEEVLENETGREEFFGLLGM